MKTIKQYRCMGCEGSGRSPMGGNCIQCAGAGLFAFSDKGKRVKPVVHQREKGLRPLDKITDATGGGFSRNDI